MTDVTRATVDSPRPMGLLQRVFGVIVLATRDVHSDCRPTGRARRADHRDPAERRTHLLDARQRDRATCHVGAG